MKLVVLLLAALVCVLGVMVSCVNASRPQVYCNLTESSTQDNFTNCTAYYYEDVVMVCPGSHDYVPTDVLWYKVGANNTIWTQNTVSLPLGQCTESQSDCVYKSLSYDDAGMYYCKCEVDQAEYYVNLTVLAPPRILSQIDHCDFPDYNECYQPEVQADRLKTTVELSTEYYGIDNISVAWSYSSSLTNQIHNNCNYTISNTSSGMWHKSVMTLDTSTMCSVEGIYGVNISSDIGWNKSSIRVAYQCNPLYPPPPGKLPEYHSHLLQVGTHQVPIKCYANFGEHYILSTNLVICFTPHNKTISSLNFTTDCITCDPSQLFQSDHTLCRGSITTQSMRNVTLSKEQMKHSLSGTCGTRYTTTLTIPTVAKNDSGTWYCLWQTKDLSVSLSKSNVYETHTTSIVSTDVDKWYPKYSIPALAALCILFLVTTCIGALICHKKKMRTLKKNYARTTPTKSIHRKPSKKNLTCQTAYGATDIQSSDDDCLFKPTATPRHQSTNYSPTNQVNVDVHPPISNRTPLLANPGPPVLKPIQEPMAGSITEAPPLCYTDLEWDLTGAQEVHSKDV